MKILRCRPGSRASGHFFLCFVLLAGVCSAADHRVKVEAMSHATTAGHLTSFWIHSGNPAIAETSLRFAEAARQIKTALSGHGLFEARDEASADLLVTIDFGIRQGAPRSERAYLPIYANDLTLPSSAPATLHERLVNPVNYDAMVGYEEIDLPVEAHEKFLYFSATENQPAAEGRPPATVWRVAASIDDESKDLRAVLPVLAAVVMESIGRETTSPAIVRMADKNPAVAFINRGPPSENQGATAERRASK